MRCTACRGGGAGADTTATGFFLVPSVSARFFPARTRSLSRSQRDPNFSCPFSPARCRRSTCRMYPRQTSTHILMISIRIITWGRGAYPWPPAFYGTFRSGSFSSACGHFLLMGPCFPEHFAPAHKWHCHTFQALCLFHFLALCPFHFLASCLFPFQAQCHFHLHSTYHAAILPPGLICWGRAWRALPSKHNLLWYILPSKHNLLWFIM